MGSFALKLSTCLAIFSLTVYDHGFHLQSLVDPNLLFSVAQSSFETFAKLEKYFAALLSSPLRKASNFISEGTSSKVKVTSFPDTVYVFILIAAIWEANCGVNFITTGWSSFRFAPNNKKIIIWASHS